MSQTETGKFQQISRRDWMLNQTTSSWFVVVETVTSSRSSISALLSLLVPSHIALEQASRWDPLRIWHPSKPKASASMVEPICTPSVC